MADSEDEDEEEERGRGKEQRKLARQRSRAWLKEGGGDAIRLSGDFLLSAIQDGTQRDLDHFVDGKAQYCHHGIDRR